MAFSTYHERENDPQWNVSAWPFFPMAGAGYTLYKLSCQLVENHYSRDSFPFLQPFDERIRRCYVGPTGITATAGRQPNMEACQEDWDDQ